MTRKIVVDTIIPHASNTNSDVQINRNVSKLVGSAMEPKIALTEVTSQTLVVSVDVSNCSHTNSIDNHTKSFDT